MTVHVGAVQASRKGEDWGYDADTFDMALQHCMAVCDGGRMVDAGSLMRIASALERIADLLDPEARAARARSAAQFRESLGLPEPERENNVGQTRPDASSIPIPAEHGD